jgi:glycosyltransferase involved in cell wall biosynthesis
MKVAIISAEWPNSSQIGGVGIYNFRLAQEFEKLGHEVTVYTCVPNRTATMLDNIKYVTLPIGKSRIARYYFFPLMIAMRLAFDSRNYDRIISSGDDWAILSTKKLVRIFHGTAKGEQTDSNYLRKINHKLIFILERLSSLRVKRRYAVGIDSCKVFKAELFPPTLGVNAMNLIKDKNISIAFVGAFFGRKKGWLADKIIGELKQLIPGVQFVVITNSNDIHKFVNADQVKSNISDKTKQKLISKATFLICTSSYEGFGIPVFEAMIEGTIPLSTKNPGSVEQLKNLPNLLVDEEDFVTVLSSLIRNKREILELQKLCKSEASLLAQKGSINQLLK